MRWFAFLSSTATALLVVAAPARATHRVVPDDVSTVQQALDALVDTVIVKDGLAPERVTVKSAVVLMPYVNTTYDHFASYPSLQSIELGSSPDGYGGSVSLRGFRVLGQLTDPARRGVDFVGCRFDSGLTVSLILPDIGPVKIEGCLVLGNLVTQAQQLQLIGNAVMGGAISAIADGNHDIRGNYVTGAPGAGVILNLQESEGDVKENTIVHCGEGIRVQGHQLHGDIMDNTIAGCEGAGILFESASSAAFGRDVVGNSIRDCGGAGISVGVNWNGARIRQNQIVDVGGDGITLPPLSIFDAIDSNTVVRSAGAGMVAGGVHVLRGNVVGRCGSDGIRLASWSDRLLEQSTSFANAGAGFSIAGNTDTLRANIAAFNTGPGLTLAGSAMTLGCNDWYANTGGATLGVSPGASDLQLDPMFCYLLGNDVHLASGSPLLNAAGCGPIGALGQGCPTALGVGTVPGITIAPVRARPVPACGGVVFEIAPSSSPGRLEVFDVSGARRWSATLPAGAASRQWDRRDASGRSLPPGIYFARLARGGAEVAATRVVLTE